MEILIRSSLLVAAVAHLIPVLGVFGSAQLSRLYGVATLQPDVLLLMQHRAVIFGLLGLFMLFAAFVRAWQGAAFLGGIVSVGAFIVLARSTGGVSAQIARVVSVDLVVMAILVIGVIAFVWRSFAK